MISSCPQIAPKLCAGQYLLSTRPASGRAALQMSPILGWLLLWGVLPQMMGLKEEDMSDTFRMAHQAR
jgi:hypothetical protein